MGYEETSGDVKCALVSDTSPKSIDREGLGESCTGTRQSRDIVAQLLYCYLPGNDDQFI